MCAEFDKYYEAQKFTLEECRKFDREICGYQDAADEEPAFRTAIDCIKEMMSTSRRRDRGGG